MEERVNKTKKKKTLEGIDRSKKKLRDLLLMTDRDSRDGSK